MHDSTFCEAPRVVKFIGTENRIVVAMGWGEVEIGNCCILGIEFQFAR